MSASQPDPTCLATDPKARFRRKLSYGGAFLLGLHILSTVGHGERMEPIAWSHLVPLAMFRLFVRPRSR